MKVVIVEISVCVVVNDVKAIIDELDPVVRSVVNEVKTAGREEIVDSIVC